MSVRKLTVTSCNVKFEGVGKTSGKAYTLYEVACRGEDGTPIEEEFKSFDMLPMGELIEYEIEREDHPKYGVSYLLKLPPGVKRPPKPNLQGDIVELRQRVARLESQVGALVGMSAPVSTPQEEIPF